MINKHLDFCQCVLREVADLKKKSVMSYTTSVGVLPRGASGCLYTTSPKPKAQETKKGADANGLREATLPTAYAYMWQKYIKCTRIM